MYRNCKHKNKLKFIQCKLFKSNGQTILLFKLKTMTLCLVRNDSLVLMKKDNLEHYCSLKHVKLKLKGQIKLMHFSGDYNRKKLILVDLVMTKITSQSQRGLV